MIAGSTLLVLVLLCAAPGWASPLAHVRTVVIDAGHGGDDPGALALCGTQEKDVALQIAIRLRDALLARDPSLVVVMTRDEDVFLPLSERARIANSAGADVFLSIHLNGSTNPEAQGVETYFLSPDGVVPGQTVPGFEQEGPTTLASPVDVAGATRASVIEDLRRRGALAEAAGLAEEIQRRLLIATGARDREVRQARFRVLRGLRMPGVLVEAGFMTHAGEGRRLQEDAYQGAIVMALVEALVGYDQRQVVMRQRWTADPQVALIGAP